MSMGRYEIIYILAPTTPEETMNELVTRFESEITDGGGVLLRVEKWGRKKLAYEVRKFREGFFVLFVADCEGAVVTELERRFRMTDTVIKFMTVRIDEELKRAGKMPHDEELGKAVETERIDRSRRSPVKPPMRPDRPAEGEGRPDAEDSDEKKAEAPVESEPAAEPESEPEAVAEEAAEAVETDKVEAPAGDDAADEETAADESEDI